MKLQKLDKFKQQKDIPKIQSARLPPFNQTIIINNPNININYLNNDKHNDPLSSRGLGQDNWNLNQNLKEFSQTRQLGFFKHKRHNDRNKSNSPYIIHKVRTQDIKNINKIYGTKNMKDTLGNFHKNQTIAHILRQEEKIEPNPPSVLEKILMKQDKTITQKFYTHKKNPRIELQKNFETLPTNFLASHLPNPETQPKTFRKNRFEIAGQNITALTQRLPHSQQSYADYDALQRRDEAEQDDEQVKIQPKSIAPRLIPFQMRKRTFNKTIESINKGLLSQTDSYFDRNFIDQVPQSQIQLCVNSLNQPQHGKSVNERSSQRCFNEWMEYDFHFDGERKKRPKTPKRKKPYEQNE